MAQFTTTVLAILLGTMVQRSHQGFLSGGIDRGNNNGNQIGGQGPPPHSLMEALQESGGFRVSGPYQVSATPLQMPSGSFPGPTPFQGGQGGFHGNRNQEGNNGKFGDSGGGFQGNGNYPRNGDNFQGPRGFQGLGNFQSPGNFQGSGSYQSAGSFQGPTGFQGHSNFPGQSNFQGHSNFQGGHSNFQGHSNFPGQSNFQGHSNFPGQSNFQGQSKPSNYQGQSNFQGQGNNFQTQGGVGGPQGGFAGAQRGFQGGLGGPLGLRSQFGPSPPPRTPEAPHVSIQPASVKVVYVPVVSTSIKASSLSKLTGEHAPGKDSTSSYFTGSGAQSGPSQQEVTKPSSYAAGTGSYGAKSVGTGKPHGHTNGGHATIPIIIIQKEQHHGAKSVQPGSYQTQTSQVSQSQQGSLSQQGLTSNGDFPKPSYGLNNRTPTETQQHQPRGHQEHHQRQQTHHRQEQQNHHQQQQHHQQVAPQQHQQQVAQRPSDHSHDSAARNTHGGTGAVIPVIIIQKTLQTAGRQQHSHHQHHSGGYNVPAAPPPVRGPTAWSPWR
ncbi:collagen alpha-2(I) chain-like [Dermacentor silvarum]|uniref:collagen alpha-2(I) chain-like n=1 Tax=Dermacentor silvarum TaxID=543639 RepID=UPI002100786C|nr:collagen alpha-2(I) chain-like [Dermacentor silvarum]